MHKRTKACAISPRVKKIVEERDGGMCIYCHRPGLPEAHYISRAQNGLGIPENIVTLCRDCHDRYDETNRDQMKDFIRGYLEQHYPGFPDSERIYCKWRY